MGLVLYWLKKSFFKGLSVSLVFSSIALCPIVFSSTVIASSTQAPLSPSQAYSIDDLLEIIRTHVLTDLKKTGDTFEQLHARQHQFTAAQKNTYTLFKATYLGLTGKHAQRVTLVKNALKDIVNANTRVKYLYELSDSYVNLGEYEQALLVMNQGIRLLPQLTELNAKASILQGAVTLLGSLNAYEDANTYALRLYQLGINADSSNYVCTGLANKIDIQFRLGHSEAAREALAQTLAICDASEYQFISGIVRAKAAIDLVDSGQFELGIAQSLAALAGFEASNKGSNYVSKLEEAIARGYHQLGQLDKADNYALQAYQHASANQSKETIRHASKTLAQIKRAKGELDAALTLYDVYLREKDSAEQERLAKNLAYQRVKYDNLDKTNQVALLKVKNAGLSLTQKLQQRNNDNLVLVVSLGTVLLVFMSILLVLSLRKKQSLMYAESPTTDLQGNADITRFAQWALEESDEQQRHFTVVLFELDFLAGFDTMLDERASQSLITQVSRICIDQIRETDQFGRINEHQFVICLLDISEQGAVALAQRVAQAIEEIVVDSEDIPKLLTSTFGIAMLCESFVDFNEALGAADIALQRARGMDENKIYVYQEQGQ